jgi:ribosomal protein L22
MAEEPNYTREVMRALYRKSYTEELVAVLAMASLRASLRNATDSDEEYKKRVDDLLRTYEKSSLRMTALVNNAVLTPELMNTVDPEDLKIAQVEARREVIEMARAFLLSPD